MQLDRQGKATEVIDRIFSADRAEFSKRLRVSLGAEEEQIITEISPNDLICKPPFDVTYTFADVSADRAEVSKRLRVSLGVEEEQIMIGISPKVLIRIAPS